MKIEFFVPGLAKPGGSKKAVNLPGIAHSVLVDDCKRNRAWRKIVAVYARQAYQGPPVRSPVSVYVIFYVARPKAHYHTGKRAGQLRDNAPLVCDKRPDATKLWRAAEDALTGILWHDDSQIWKQEVVKIYSFTPGMNIIVNTETQPDASMTGAQPLQGILPLMRTAYGDAKHD